MSEVVAKLDDLGQPAWIAVMVLSFILVWPVGLAVLAYLLWSGRMGSCARRDGWGEDPRARWERKMARLQEKLDRWSAGGAAARGWRGRPGGHGAYAPSGNRAFDEYRSETLRRLEEEANEFRVFLERLRHAKDKAEFDQFMADRRQRPTPPTSGDIEPKPQG
jgi:hypothetical protein